MKKIVRAQFPIHIRSSYFFTLIELLIVIAMIAILASMLLPALNRARETARSSSCKSNVRQLGMAFLYYASDFGDMLPKWYFSGGTVGLYWTANLSLNNYLPRKSFLCPGRTVPHPSEASYAKWSDGKTYTKEEWFWLLPDYGYNTYFLGGSQNDICGGVPALLSGVKNPSGKVMAADSARNPADITGNLGRFSGYCKIVPAYTASDSIAWPRHNGETECNVVWVDGHASGVRSAANGETGAKALYNGPLLNYYQTRNAWDRN